LSTSFIISVAFLLAAPETEIIMSELVNRKDNTKANTRPPNSAMELFNEIESLFQNLDNENKEQIIVLMYL
jgi:hypothetical protein